MTATPDSDRRALQLRIAGVVQGVGFRPFIYRIATRHHLAGWVRNNAGEVHVTVEGHGPELDQFLTSLRHDSPPLAVIDTVECIPTGLAGFDQFAILPSQNDPARRKPVPADVAMCSACEQELRDQGNRRYRYPFITCTDCGPRFSIVDSLPYDRERTTMAAFAQCPQCLAEYNTPGNRRHHSETNSCPACGPTLWFESIDGARAPVAFEAAVALLARGGILALRGMGGFHLACDATSESAVGLLRQRKRRVAKPFAVMVRDLAMARELVDLDTQEIALLAGRERPIVLLPLKAGHPLSPLVAPGLDRVGLMLPATPLHQLLLDDLGRPLVMTSGNLSEEPIVMGNDEARQSLSHLVDGFLLHDREILARLDDSVLRPAAGGTIVLRRARGFAPLPLRLPMASPVPLLAVGPHLKNTFTMVDRADAFVSPHLGDLESVESLQHFRSMQGAYRRFFQIEPAAVAHDLHPGYLSTRIAQELGLTPCLGVQHHHAHVAAVMAEHGVTGPVLGIAYDGTGYGDDGAIWGAEILQADLLGYRRLAHFRYVPLPGGDLAARRLWRIVLGYCSLHPNARAFFTGVFSGIDPGELKLAQRQLETGVNCPRASSMGRLFDAAAAILGVCRTATYEGQGAMELEALAGLRPAAEYGSPIHLTDGGTWEIDPLPLLLDLASRKARGYPVADLAADFHASIAWVTEEVVRRAVERTGLTTVVLSGGTFQNARLVGSLQRRFEARGLRVLIPRMLPAGDGGISYGQAAVAAARLSDSHRPVSGH